MARTVTHRLTIVRSVPGVVTCSGRFETADGKGIHSLLHPVLFEDEVEHKQPMEVGDVVLRYDDGTHEHLPRVK